MANTINTNDPKEFVLALFYFFEVLRSSGLQFDLHPADFQLTHKPSCYDECKYEINQTYLCAIVSIYESSVSSCCQFSIHVINGSYQNLFFH